MGNKDEMQRLEDSLAEAGSQWRDEDLDDILALLDKDYTKPQPARPEPAGEVLPEVNLRLDPEPGVPEAPEEISTRPGMQLPDLRSLMAEEHPPVTLPQPEQLNLGQVPVQEASEEVDFLPAPEFKEEYIPAEPHRAGTGEQPDFDETPAKKQKPGSLILLGLLAGVEIAALVLIFIWWQQWIA